MKVATKLQLLFLYFLIFPGFIITHCVSSESIDNSWIYIGGEGSGNYTSIQDAVDNANIGDTIYVFNGTYYENILVDKSLNFIGENRNNTIIDSGKKDSIFTLYADQVTISGFTLQHSKNKFPYAGISVQSDKNMIFENNMNNNYYGIVLLNQTSGNTVTKNKINNNNQCGIYFSGATYNILTDNYVDNQPFNGFGLYEYSDNNVVKNNTFLHMGHSGVNIRDSYGNQVIGNTFIENYRGLYVPLPEFNTFVSKNSFSDNKIVIEEERELIVYSLISFFVLGLFSYFFLRRFVI